MHIGVFDSGIGGLTVLAALDAALPDHDLTYLGDMARVPYGTRSPETVRRYALRVASFLHARGAEALVIACNTATAHALPAVTAAGARLGIPVFGVIEPGVQAALETHREGAIAVLGTEGTIRGGAYQRALAMHAPQVAVAAVPCPLFVPLAEEGWTDGPVPNLIAARYLSPLVGRVDTIILGCTHYPLLREVIQAQLPGARLVDAAWRLARAVRDDLGPRQPGTGTRRFLVTDLTDSFARTGRRFLGRAPEPVSWVDLPAPTGPFADPPE